MKCVTVTAPVNIAAIKYWGKSDPELIIPVNDSLSFTLNQDDMCATTTAMLLPGAPGIPEVKMWLNGGAVAVEDNSRVARVIRSVKDLAGKSRACNEEDLKKVLRIASVNNFPTAAGLASSAAGYAALAAAVAAVYGVEETGSNLSKIARMGSGSACRSMLGGFVQWTAGQSNEDSFAVQVAPREHWPSIRFLICVTRTSPKLVGSTDGMQLTVATSPLFQARVASVLPKMKSIIEAIKSKNFAEFAEIAMRDSNQLHAVCLDTFPPLVYMNDVSHRIVMAVHEYNRVSGAVVAGYTFDAGPNACLFVDGDARFSELCGVISHFFKPASADQTVFFTGTTPSSLPDVANLTSRMRVEPMPGGVRFVIGTSLGDGPRIFKNDAKKSLLDSSGEFVPRR